MKQVDRLEAGAHRPFPAPAFHVQRRGVPGLPATRWPRRCWPMACVSSPAASRHHRPRGIVAAGVEGPTPSCSSKPGHTACRMRAPPRSSCTRPGGVQRECKPSLERDRLAINQRLARPARRLLLQDLHVAAPPVAPLRGQDPRGRRPGQRAGCPRCRRYDKRYAHCDVLVLGGGPAGLAAADAAAATGARVILVDEQRELGGSLLSCPAEIDGEPALRWAGRIEAGLRQRPDVRILTRGTAFGYQDHNLVTVAQRLTDHLPVDARGFARAAVEDPGRPGDPGDRRARASAGVRQQRPAGRDAGLGRVGLHPSLWRAARRDAVLFTNNDRAYQAAIDLADCGAGSSWWMPAPRSTASCRTPPGALA